MTSLLAAYSPLSTASRVNAAMSAGSAMLIFSTVAIQLLTFDGGKYSYHCEPAAHDPSKKTRTLALPPYKTPENKPQALNGFCYCRRSNSTLAKNSQKKVKSKEENTANKSPPP